MPPSRKIFMSSPRCSFRLRVVLWCSGVGGDASTYRPQRDDSQWWGRRDALVRCVAATGAATELVLLFDDDLSRMEMKRTTSAEALPESVVVALWKRACQKPNETMTSRTPCKSLACKLVTVKKNDDISRDAESNKRFCSSASKKDLLSLLQENCSLEFLREHKLNSSPAVLLRKMNRATLSTVWQKWNKGQENKKRKRDEKDDCRLDRLYEQIISASPSSHRPVVATLHERFPELPCFGDYLQKDEGIYDSDNPPIFLTVVLGAVRDMTDEEQKSLKNVCRKAKIPHVSMRLGPVPEFTSKILSIVYSHSAHGKLEGAVEWMMKSSKYLNLDCHSESKCKAVTSIDSRGILSSLHVLCEVPISSTDLSTSLGDRDSIHWSLVRIVVSTLWRSKFMTSTSACVCSLTIIFLDQAMTLHQDSFVSELANQHQAAPSEYQILSALKSKVKAATCSLPLGQQVEDCIESLLPSKESSHVEKLAMEAKFALDGESTAAIPSELIDGFYSDRSSLSHSACIFLIFHIQQSSINNAAVSCAFQSRNIPLRTVCFVSPSYADRHASAIVFVQHMLNQRRIFFKGKKFGQTGDKVPVDKKGAREKSNRKKKRKKKSGQQESLQL